MAAITAASIVYSQPVSTKVGGWLLTVTNAEIVTGTEEYVEGGFELLPEKLGLTDGVVAPPPFGQIAESGPENEVPGAIWTSAIAPKKELYESAKLVPEIFPTMTVLIKGKPFVRIFQQEKAEAGKFMLEPKTATKVKLAKFIVTVVALGK